MEIACQGDGNGIAVQSVLFLFIVFLNRQFRVSGSLNLIADKDWVRFLFFPVLTIACMTVFAMEGGGGRAVLAASFAMVFSNFLIFYVIRGVAAKLNGLLKSGNYREMEQYVGKLANGWIEEMDYMNANHAMVNSILNQKYKQAKSLGIPILFSVNDLGELPVGDEDIVVLLSNLLDNAIEACQRLAEGEKWIKFCFLMEENKVVISIRNPVREPVKVTDGRPETTKTNRREHGIGMANIQSVVDKYGGENIWNCREGYFTQSIIFHNGRGF